MGARVAAPDFRYLQLAHNEWGAKAGHSVVRVLYGFGREDQLDRGAIVRLIGSLHRALEPDQALAAAAAPGLRLQKARLPARRDHRRTPQPPRTITDASRTLNPPEWVLLSLDPPIWMDIPSGLDERVTS